MQLKQFSAASDALLDYALSTAPAPVQVSQSASDPSHATLTFVISNPGADVSVTQIAFDLPVGNPQQPAAPDLTEQPKGIGCSVSDSAWQIGPGVAAGSFVLKSASGQPIAVGDQGIAVTLSNIEVSTVVGTAEVTIVEDASRPQANQPLANRTCTLDVAKFPYGFYAGNLALAQPTVAHGATATLTWIGSDAPATTYTMLWAEQSTDVTHVRQWTSPALTDTTTFILEVQTTSPDGPVRVWYSVTEIVSDPSIVATDLTVLTTASIGDTATIAGGAVVGSATDPAGMTVNGAFVAKTLGVNGGGTIDGGLHADALVVDGSVTCASLSASGALSAGSVQAKGAVAAQTVQVGDWTISQASDGSLAFRSASGHSVAFEPNVVLVDGVRCLRHSDPVYVQRANSGAYLNGTVHGDGDHGPNWDKWAYWMNDGDGDSNLTIYYGNPF